MHWFDELISSYLSYKNRTFSNPLLEKIKNSRELFLNEEEPLKRALNLLERRAEEPMKVAIAGQFSSGKSTFLNALLGKNILPTGITPVTSKVNYIRYGDNFQLQVHYHDGREAFYGIENITRFTDQRGEMEEVSHLTLYAPLELLKEIVFVDTPGLNSESKSDTEATQRVLKEVDGIIWLTLMDNAGKQSEIEALESFMDSYSLKSLCVINQKDKFTQTEVETTLDYVKKALSKYFIEFVAISAKQALSALSTSKEKLLDKEIENFLSNVKNAAKKDENFSKLIEDFKLTKEQVSKKEYDLGALKESNIELVFKFIEDNIKPQAKESKAFAVTKELENIINKIVLQHLELLRGYEELESEFIAFEKEVQKRFEKLKERFGKELQQAYLKIEEMIERVAVEIYSKIKREHKKRFSLEKKGVLSKKERYEVFTYEVAKIDTDAIYKTLFYDDNIIGKMFKKYVKYIRTIQDGVNEENGLIYKELEFSILKWQKTYEHLMPKDELYSKDEFAKMRRFASKVYELFLKPFNDEIRASFALISSEFRHLSSAINFNYQNATEVSIGFLERKINESIALYEESPNLFPLYEPSLDEIKERLKISFHMYELNNYMNTNRTFLHKNYDWLMSRFEKIRTSHCNHLKEKTSLHKDEINKLNKSFSNNYK